MLIGAPTAYAKDSKEDRFKRKGGQADFTIGMSACIPGKGRCKDGAASKTAPMVGFALDLGYRINKYMFTGAGYSLGFFDPQYIVSGKNAFSHAFQSTVVAVLRGIVPAGRLDLGFDLSPGWSRVTFKTGAQTNYSQGFALKPGFSAMLWFGPQIFAGLKADTIFNFHRTVCKRNGGSTSCEVNPRDKHTLVHQAILGVHIGGTF